MINAKKLINKDQQKIFKKIRKWQEEIRKKERPVDRNLKFGVRQKIFIIGGWQQGSVTRSRMDSAPLNRFVFRIND